ncbi:MAG: T9SS type A sorting domain-containing protein [Bacteroidetes bacterium]|nr:T9SS type A sorting domain-containing protein [Bacteroidota bacterium]
MKIKSLNVITLILTLLLISSQYSFAERDVSKNNKDKLSLSKTDGSPSYTRFNINRTSTWIKNDGETDIQQSGNSGFIYPKGSNKAVFFQSGFVWGGKVNGEIRVGGSTYNQGLLPGAVVNGVREDETAEHVRIYRVRRDYKTGDLSQEAADEGLTNAEVYAQYEKDWNEWPAAYGAPYEDINGNGSYEAATDIPGEPGADQTVWFVANDFDPVTAQVLYGSLPLGLEMQATVFGYNQTGALGSMLFRKFLLINKSADDIEEFYVCMWSDPDLGDAGDDYAGCDTTLSLGYIYNGDADDATYGRNPAAGGFDFFQGPIVDGDAGDVAIFKGREVHGKRNLGMSAFFFFINSDPIYTDPRLGEYADGTLQMYNLFEGKIGTTGAPFIDPNTGQATKFTLAGDPISGTGWLDGQLHPPGDRRIGQVAGPFVMAAGDTQEVVVAQIAAGAEPGIDRIGAVGLLKFYDKTAQLIYDNFFQVVSAPLAPVVNVAELDQSIVLSWGGDINTVNQTESADAGGFTFQGYNVYQLPNRTASINEAVRVANFDVADGVGKITDEYFDVNSGVVGRRVVQFGTDSGIKRFVEVKYDAFSGGLPLVNGTRYYFAVTAYSYNPDPQAVPNNLENPLNILTIVPHSENPGERYSENYGDVTRAAHSGSSDGFVEYVVVDPNLATGHEYKVEFYLNDDGDKVWKLTDVTTGVVKLSNYPENVGDDAPIVDGLQIKVSGAPADFKDFLTVANAAGPLDPFTGAAAEFQGFPTPERPGARQQVGAGAWLFHTGDNGGTNDGGTYGSYTAFKGRSMRNDNFDRLVPFDWEMRFTAGGSWAVRAFQDGLIVQVPFELWCTGINTPNDPSDDYRMIPWILDNADNMMYDLESWGSSGNGGGPGGFEHSVSGGDNDPFTDWIYWIQPDDHSAGTAGYDAFVASLDIGAGTEGTYDYGGHEVIARSVLVNFNGGSAPPFNMDLPEEGTIFRLVSTKPNQVGSDVFTFTAPSKSVDVDLAKDDVKNINVFPNPYYGVNSEEINKYQRFVTFNHLPNKATLRIFNLAGQLIRTIEKNSSTQFEQWDLLNKSGLPVASGLYIVYIDMPDLGTTKILKAAIIQEQQILDRF